MTDFKFYIKNAKNKNVAGIDVEIGDINFKSSTRAKSISLDDGIYDINLFEAESQWTLSFNIKVANDTAEIISYVADLAEAEGTNITVYMIEEDDSAPIEPEIDSDDTLSVEDNNINPMEENSSEIAVDENIGISDDNDNQLDQNTENDTVDMENDVVEEDSVVDKVEIQEPVTITTDDISDGLSDVTELVGIKSFAVTGKPINIYSIPTKKSPFISYVGGLALNAEIDGGFVEVIYTNKGLGKRTIGYVKFQDIKKYL